MDNALNIKPARLPNVAYPSGRRGGRLFDAGQACLHVTYLSGSRYTKRAFQCAPERVLDAAAKLGQADNAVRVLVIGGWFHSAI